MLKIKYIKLFLLIMWMGVIFIMSNTPVDDSWKLSSKVANEVVKKTENVNHNAYNFLENINKDTLNIIVRKIAHMGEYFILFILCYIFLKDKKLKHIIITSAIFAVAYAASDEFHQLCIVGREGTIRDVFIDSIGVMFGVVVILLIKKLSGLKSKSLAH